jgi:hypothetical protein
MIRCSCSSVSLAERLLPDDSNMVNCNALEFTINQEQEELLVDELGRGIRDVGGISVLLRHSQALLFAKVFRILLLSRSLTTLPSLHDSIGLC